MNTLPPARTLPSGRFDANAVPFARSAPKMEIIPPGDNGCRAAKLAALTTPPGVIFGVGRVDRVLPFSSMDFLSPDSAHSAVRVSRALVLAWPWSHLPLQCPPF